MLVFFIKQALNLKRAIFGRREPHQLAWGLALGVLLGIVPHGNLLALALLLVILSLRINHGMMAVTAAATSFLAWRLDPFSDALGGYLLAHPSLTDFFVMAWQLPLVPWTEINNTVVVGSLTIGLLLLFPLYLVAYPVFHFLAPVTPAVPGFQPTPSGAAAQGEPEVKPDTVDGRDKRPRGSQHSPGEPEVNPEAVDAALAEAIRRQQAAAKEAVDTRIEVVRLTSAPPAAVAPPASDLSRADDEVEHAAGGSTAADRPMAETLNYLLRQLRDLRHGRAA